MVPVQYTAGEQPGKVTRKIHIATDQGDDAATEVTAYAQVVLNDKPKAAQRREKQVTALLDAADSLDEQ